MHSFFFFLGWCGFDGFGNLLFSFLFFCMWNILPSSLFSFLFVNRLELLRCILCLTRGLHSVYIQGSSMIFPYDLVQFFVNWDHRTFLSLVVVLIPSKSPVGDYDPFWLALFLWDMGWIGQNFLGCIFLFCVIVHLPWLLYQGQGKSHGRAGSYSNSMKVIGLLASIVLCIKRENAS